MKPIWRGGKLTVELHKTDCKLLSRARGIGMALVAMQQQNGQPLVDAIDAILDSGQELLDEFNKDLEE